MPPTQLSAVHPSPKRKRDQPPQVPLINTALRPASSPIKGSPTPSSGSDSPRNAVADQLRGMTLTAISAIPMSPLTPTDDIVRKKPKLEMKRGDSGGLPENAFSVISSGPTFNPRTTPSVMIADTDDAREIPETPQSQAQQPRTLPDIAAFAQPTTFTSSPLNAVSQDSKYLGMPKSKSRSSQPRPRQMSPSPPLSELTWQDDEITGHLADPSKDPEDDGTGLNGIGFKPTPAIAYARAQKRRQQLMEWRTREAREARAKRTERRRRGVGGSASRETTVEREMPSTAKGTDAIRRSVKFAV
ncbi:hypothetical protein BS50DRAFT_577380 [Corynespora cassiicola Philippines]|uniref:Uncharacterized protein n=1 Tax=Corynespora cassiicola Philippines TaxID=1448308 RepID=A0A2T2NBQ7_CORCC|nr:hypothetical protein BS50DRAFT_577380 [Corynespora cassiicola Philippines]